MCIDLGVLELVGLMHTLGWFDVAIVGWFDEYGRLVLCIVAIGWFDVYCWLV